MIIDAHVHYTPPELRDNLDGFFKEEPFWGLLLAPGPDGRSLQGWASAERMIEDMDAAGVDKAVLMGEYRRSHEACVARNDQALQHHAAVARPGDPLRRGPAESRPRQRSTRSRGAWTRA